MSIGHVSVFLLTQGKIMLCASGQIVTAKLDRNCYRRLQILFQGRGSGEGFSLVLPQTICFRLFSL